MIETFKCKLERKSNRELELLSKELSYYSEEEQELIKSELKNRLDKEVKEKRRTISLSRFEFICVLIIGFGIFLFFSTIRFLQINPEIGKTEFLPFGNFGLYTTVIYEVIALIIIGIILKSRNWKLSDFHLNFKVKMIFIALLLLIIYTIIVRLAIFSLEQFNIIQPEAIGKTSISVSANWISIGLIVIVNSFYEEFLLVGYLFKKLEKYNAVFIIGFSMLIRFSLHTYQGWISLITISSLGLVFGIYYLKFKKLWPLVIAHGFYNLIVFSGAYFQSHENF